jgi:hypothetical protein
MLRYEKQRYFLFVIVFVSREFGTEKKEYMRSNAWQERAQTQHIL